MSISEKTLEKLFSNSSLVLVLIGVLLIIVGAAGGWANLSIEINDSKWQIVLAIVGVSLIGAGTFIIVKDKSVKPKSNQLGIRIISPNSGNEVAEETEIYGVFDHLPENTLLKIFTKSLKTNEYWPQPTDVSIDKEKNTWSGYVHIGENEGKQRQIVITAIGEAGKNACQYYEKVGREIHTWIGFDQLPPGTTVFDSVIVRRGHKSSPVMEKRNLESERPIILREDKK